MGIPKMRHGDDRTALRIRGNGARTFWAGVMLMLGLVVAPDVTVH